MRDFFEESKNCSAVVYWAANGHELHHNVMSLRPWGERCRNAVKIARGEMNETGHCRQSYSDTSKLRVFFMHQLDYALAPKSLSSLLQNFDAQK